MARKHSFQPEPHETVIAAGVELKGNLHSENDIWFDGVIAGNISSSGSVTIGPSGQVAGNVKGRQVVIAGAVDGNVRAIEQLYLQETARLRGDAAATTLAVGAGAVLNGGVTMPSRKGTGSNANDDKAQPDQS